MACLLLLLILTVYTVVSFKLGDWTGFIVTAVLGLIYVIIFRLFILDFYKVPSESMENAIFPDDKLVVNKLVYGPKFPRGIADIPWLNNLSIKSRDWPYLRLSGTARVKRGDIIVFKKTKDTSSFFVKRCIGLPGDKIILAGDSISVDGKELHQNPTVKNRYRFTIGQREEFIKYALKNDIFYEVNEDSSISAYLTRDQKQKFHSMAAGGKIAYVPIGWRFFCDMPKQLREESLSKWTGDSFGPLTVPAKNLYIKLTGSNIYLYYQAILSETKDVKLIGRKLYLHGQKLEDYRFNRDYYFFMGDNRHRSYDSRYWGFISEEQIEGKVVFSFRF
ncbi:signal peptidase I [Pedobacter miscanthi]|nr:signal peptidase I [Pedobacter miscanthi]